MTEGCQHMTLAGMSAVPWILQMFSVHFARCLYLVLEVFTINISHVYVCLGKTTHNKYVLVFTKTRMDLFIKTIVFCFGCKKCVGKVFLRHTHHNQSLFTFHVSLFLSCASCNASGYFIMTYVVYI